MLIPFSLLTLSYLILALLTSFTHSASPPFNISHFLFPASNAVVDHHQSQPSSPFLKDVLKAIGEKEKWNLEDVRVSKLDVKKAKFGAVQKYEFRVRFGKSEFVFKLLDQVSRWKRFERAKNESDFEAFMKEISSEAVLDTFKVRGPFELRVSGDHELNLMLPLNASFTGLKHILVGEGITVEVKGAKEISFFRKTDLSKIVNGSVVSSLERSSFGYFWPSLCFAWLPIHILGSATVVGYRTRNPEAYLETFFPSKRTVELLPEKCYSRHVYRKWSASIDSLSTRIAFLEKIFWTFVGYKTNLNAASGSLNTKIIASSVFRFQLELERDILRNDTYWSTLAEWRTKPTVEHVWFEVVARIEEEILKPLMIKKVRPFIEADSKAWSNLMSNVSFTKFPSILVPQESLTLDVKW